VYSGSCPSCSVVKEWAKSVMGQEWLEDDAKSGRPVEVIRDDNIALAEAMILSDRR
jgi:hypothetical protein